MPEEGILNSEDDISNSPSNNNESTINVSITTAPYASVEFKGSLESVYKDIIDFIVKQFPEIDIMKISLNYSPDYLVKKYSNLITVDSDKCTVQVLVQPDKLKEVESRTKEDEKEDSEHKLETLGDFREEGEIPATKSYESAVTSDDFYSSSVSVMPALSSELDDGMKIKKEPTSALAKNWKWSLKELIGLHLVASRIANDLGMSQDKGLQIYEIEYATRANPKSVNSRLSEMVKSGLVLRDIKFSDNTDSGVSRLEDKPYTIYAITTMGIHWLNHIIDTKEKT